MHFPVSPAHLDSVAPKVSVQGAWIEAGEGGPRPEVRLEATLGAAGDGPAAFSAGSSLLTQTQECGEPGGEGGCRAAGARSTTMLDLQNHKAHCAKPQTHEPVGAHHPGTSENRTRGGDIAQ